MAQAWTQYVKDTGLTDSTPPPAPTHAGAHMERDFLPPIRDVPEDVAVLAMDQIEVRLYFRGFVKSLERNAA